ncbi:MAG: SDR family NAD(P)-dependent oxidoreductase [Verrucomicrobia bacterium]|nr:MAG: SDR family NAD(P)-dependent oxidoreductase [Verrucomicrobiota bacterium]
MRALQTMLSEYAVIIVTGGSSGIGKSFIEHAWKLNSGVIICNLSRRQPLDFNGKLNARHFPVNLGDSVALANTAAELLRFLREGVPPGRVMLVNNSGFGGYGRVDELERAHQLEMIDVNVRAVVDLTARLLPFLQARGGAVLNIASIAGFQPTAFMSTYGASKAFLLHWSLGLGEDLRGSGVHVLAVCPGPTTTEFFKRAGLKEGAINARWGQTSDQVVLEAWQALARGRTQVICGWVNWALSVLAARLPKPWAARVGARVLAKYRLSRTTAPTSPPLPSPTRETRP